MEERSPATGKLYTFKSMSMLALLFTCITVLLIVVFGIMYVSEVRDSLALRGTAPCAYDSMVKQSCEHPYSTSFFWSGLLFVFTCWPLIIAWLVTGGMLLLRRSTRPGQGVKAHHPPKSIHAVK